MEMRDNDNATRVLAFSLPSEYRVNVTITTRFSYVESGTNIAQYLSVFHGHIFTYCVIIWERIKCYSRERAGRPSTLETENPL